MFSLFKKKHTKNVSGAELAMNGLKNISVAIAQNMISLEKGRIHDDIYVHADTPEGKTRVSYVMFSSTVKNEVIARCSVFNDRVENGVSVWQVDWAVAEQYRNQGFGTAVATKAVEEFKSGMNGRLTGGFCLEAVVDPDNAKSNRIAANLIGNCESGVDTATGKRAYSYLLHVPG